MKIIFVLILILQFSSPPIITVGLAKLVFPVSPILNSSELFKNSDNNTSKLETMDISLEACDYERGFGQTSVDGFTSFNLLLAYPTGNTNISFYESREDLNNGTEILSPENYRNTQAFNQTILARRGIGNNTVIEEVNLTVIPIPEDPVPIGEFYACNSNTDGGSPTAIYNFEEIGQSIFGAEEVSFHANLDEAFENDENFVFGDVLAQELIIYVRKQNNNCEPIYSLSLKILDKPVIQLEEEYQICANEDYLDLNLPSENFSYEWYKEDEDYPFSGSSNVEISEMGTYSVIATQTFNINNTLYECSTEKSFSVEIFKEPEIETIELEQGTNNQFLVLMTESGDYEYSTSYLNGNYQDSNLFENAPPGNHEIYVREKNGCGVATRVVSILGFPPFFTPNNDGINDFWQIKGTSTSNNPVHIYDRYGKLLSRLNPNEKGWDGNYNGKSMPADDYWFWVRLENGQELKGHFSLVR